MFQCTENDLLQAFSPFGPIQEYKLPQKDGHCSGFAFVQYRRFPDAYKALKSMNATTLLNRTIALDWAVPKDQYMTSVMESKAKEKIADSATDNNVVVEKPEKRLDRGKKSKDAQQTEYVAKKAGNADDETLSQRKRRTMKNNSFPQQSQHASDMTRDFDQLSSSSEGSVSQTKPPEVPRRTGDDPGIREGRTLFVRNLPFETTDEEFGEYFSRFGPLKYAVTCKYPNTDHSKGTGFVQFLNKDSVEKCLQAANTSEGTGIYIKSQLISVCHAVSRDQATKIVRERGDEKHKPKDKRNLHLFKAGLISQNEATASDMSKHDISLRMKIQRTNKEKIKNLHIFVSPTRICVHNLPLGLSDVQLRKLCFAAVSERSCRITECRIMRDMTMLNKDKIGKSRGFAFVTFTDHEHAMKCLKQLNNNPETFSYEKRPIIEFSLENKAALNLKQRRLEHSRAYTVKARKLKEKEK
ncbi:unnamed protein product [Soboliphyme baturini]|uniref:RNA-binding protein 28 n=1 Tax=Soboliphyme baturini TaxID=241478 RepID=A0A183IEX6_9BILA|nr:unnamed protein product [Soboliphyme baturini]